MKKLMIAAAIVCAAITSQAAAIAWNSGAITLSDGTTTAAKANATAYLFLIEKGTYDDLALSATSGKALSDAVWAAYGAGITADPPTYDATKDSTAKGVAKLDTGKTDYGVGTYYAAILYTDNTNPGYYMGNIATAVVEGAVDAETSNLATVIGGNDGTVATAWSTAAVPEPTSGLLILLGVAGLALRRRRA